ncbi:O-fucosyltransferase 30-like [Nicotiana tabacum]|uniref:O-fucosyltransferase family protein n=2 Tax=Nicotiana TaxID=4085 RepID=A0A1S4CBJ8_TOBAC|nr:PREDICTED: uncharacterized protein LOC104237239 [Nicotiana sylvestris]XP_016498602.1 PREDICTED: uncharacterized protein LOC107817317 [Nicotiana tabacum]
METETFIRPNKSKRKQRSPLLIFLFLFTLIFLFYYFKNFISPSLLPLPQKSKIPIIPRPSQCNPTNRLQGKFLWYAPHSGFSNQLAEFKNAILMAKILNRTLIVPPVLDHHAVALGSCPKFRVLNPIELRYAVWNHSIHLLRDCRYVSMADIVDISPLVSYSTVRFIDFRAFVSLWCGVNFDDICSKDQTIPYPLSERLRECGSLLSGYYGSISDCLTALEDDCRMTVWTYQNDVEDGALDSFQPDEQLKKKKKISFIRRRKDVYKALGPGSAAESATILAFGSLFTAPYKGSESHIDIHESPNDPVIQTLIEKIEFLPFVPEIVNAGKKFALQTIKGPFLCAQLRLLDGQFKNHHKATFLGLQQKLESLKQTGQKPIHVFVMTDLPMANWTGSYLGSIAKDSDAFKLFVIREEDDLVQETVKEVMAAGHGLKLGSILPSSAGTNNRHHPQSLTDVLLYIEETVCSCASLGFVGTAGSTIAESIELMRKHGICSG